jgi:hypothetical protein
MKRVLGIAHMKIRLVWIPSMLEPADSKWMSMADPSMVELVKFKWMPSVTAAMMQQ